MTEPPQDAVPTERKATPPPRGGRALWTGAAILLVGLLLNLFNPRLQWARPNSNQYVIGWLPVVILLAYDFRFAVLRHREDEPAVLVVVVTKFVLGDAERIGLSLSPPVHDLSRPIQRNDSGFR